MSCIPLMTLNFLNPNLKFKSLKQFKTLMYFFSIFLANGDYGPHGKRTCITVVILRPDEIFLLTLLLFTLHQTKFF